MGSWVRTGELVPIQFKGLLPTPSSPPPTSSAPLTADDIEMTKVPPPDTDSTHFSEFMSTPYGKQVSICVCGVSGVFPGEYLCIGGVSWGYSSVESLVLNGLTVCHVINLRVAMTGICWVACKRGMWNGCECPDQPKMGINYNSDCKTTNVTSCSLSISLDCYRMWELGCVRLQVDVKSLWSMQQTTRG